jgi:tetratricopeptide (TPR) repeat protein
LSEKGFSVSNLIVNKKRKQQIVEFIDKDHDVMDKFYDIMDEGLSGKKLITEMKKLIAIDEDFYDPYLVIAEMLFYDGKNQDAQALLKDAYERAVKRITDSQGRWPKIMQWGFLENRHIMRALGAYANECWSQKDIATALDIYRRLLRVNPNDNQGARYNILAIRMNYEPDELEKKFKVESDGVVIGLDAFKMNKWFQTHAKKFQDEFEYFFSFHDES